MRGPLHAQEQQVKNGCYALHSAVRTELEVKGRVITCAARYTDRGDWCVRTWLHILGPTSDSDYWED
jgi:hypothetical protein